MISISFSVQPQRCRIQQFLRYSLNAPQKEKFSYDRFDYDYFYDQYVCNYGCRENEWPRVEKQSCCTYFLYISRLFPVKARLK